MAPPPVTPQAATAWDEQGNPTQPVQPSATTATAWDESGNPIQQGAQQDKGFFSTALSDLEDAGRTMLKNLSTPTYQKIVNPQHASAWDASMQAKDRMMESAKQGDALGVAQHAAGIIPVAANVDAAMTKYQQEPTHENLAHVVTTAIPAFLPSLFRGAGKVAGAISEAGEATEATPKPGIVKQIIKGEKAAQPEAQQALSTAAGGEPTASLRESLTKPIAESEAKASSLYKEIDKTAGFDIKQANQKLQNINRQLRQLTDTPEDQAMEAKLETARTGLMDKLEQSGVDPKLLKQADAQYRQTRALADVEAKVFKNPDIVEGNQRFGTEETVNVDKAIKALERLQGSKYGARVEQAFGKEGANQLMSKLYSAQRTGAHALKMQTVAKWVGGIIGASTIAEGIAIATKPATP